MAKESKNSTTVKVVSIILVAAMVLTFVSALIAVIMSMSAGA